MGYRPLDWHPLLYFLHSTSPRASTAVTEGLAVRLLSRNKRNRPTTVGCGGAIARREAPVSCLLTGVAWLAKRSPPEGIVLLKKLSVSVLLLG